MTAQKPVAWRLWDIDVFNEGRWYYYDAEDFREGLDPRTVVPELRPLYAAADATKDQQ